MSVERLRVEQNERVDIGDFQFQSDEGLNIMAEHTPGQMLTDPSGNRAWILEGFAIDNPAGNQVRVTKGRAILSRREGGVVTHGMVTSVGDATKIIDTTAFTAAVHGIYVRFEYVDGDTLGRVFWDSSSAAEFSQNVATRRKANWSMRIEQTNPGAEWFKIGEVDLSIGPGSITDQRNFYFEGAVDTSFANTWGTGTDRNATRAVDGIKDLQEFTAAVRTLFEQLRPSGVRWWQDRGLDVTGVTANETGVIGRGAATNGIGTEGLGAGTGSGVRGTGGGTDGSIGVEGVTAATNGLGVRGTGTGSGNGVEGVGGGTDGTDGVVGTTTATNGTGVRGTGAGTGTGGNFLGGATGPGCFGQSGGGGSFGVEGFSGTAAAAVRGTASSGTGFGVEAQADLTSPVRAALKLTPQDTDPSNLTAGQVYFNDVSNKISGHNGTTWDRYVAQSFALIADDTRATAGNFSSTYTIPANTLRVGSTIRIRAWGTETTGSAGSANYRTSVGGVIIGNLVVAINHTDTDFFYIEGAVTLQALGAPGTARSAIVTSAGTEANPVGSDGAATDVQVFHNISQPALTTTGAIVVAINISSSGGDGSYTLQGFIVDVL